MTITWSNGLSIGVKHIDHQHKEMIARVNRLLDAMSKGKGVAEIEGAIKFLEAYVVVHFKAEEELMKEHAYPALQSHLLEHERLKKEVARLRQQYIDGTETSLLFSAARRLCITWFTYHLNNVDRSFGHYLKTRGVKNRS
jgi:hemerythrin